MAFTNCMHPNDERIHLCFKRFFSDAAVLSKTHARDLWPPELHGITRHSTKFATLYSDVSTTLSVGLLNLINVTASSYHDNSV